MDVRLRVQVVRLERGTAAGAVSRMGLPLLATRRQEPHTFLTMKLIPTWDDITPGSLGPALDAKMRAAVEAGATLDEARLAMHDVLLRDVQQLRPSASWSVDVTLNTKMLALDFGYRRIMEFTP